MKIRTGFVSNSSSSSFLLVMKGESEEEAKQAFRKAFALPSGHPLTSLFDEDPGKTILSCVDETYVGEEGAEKYKTEATKWGEELNAEDNQNLEYLKNGYTVCRGSFSDESGTLETALCDADIDFENEDIILRSPSGY
jgi:hypothetical protein